MKTSAFTSEMGGERIAASDALHRRRADGGKSRNVTYWSTHRLGQRVPMHLVDSDVRRLHFAENSKGSGGGGEETMEHWLFKHALATLERVRLVIKGQSHVLVLQRGAVEPHYEGTALAYRADAHWHFTSDTLLDKEWGNEVYVEVHHEHPVPDGKLQALKAAGLPVIEVSIPAFLAFGGGEEASLAQQDAQKARVHRFLNDADRYFLPATVLHGPVSPVIVAARQALALAENAALAAQAELATAQRQWAAQVQARHEALRAARAMIPTVHTAVPMASSPSWVLVSDPLSTELAVVPSSCPAPGGVDAAAPEASKDPRTRWWRRTAWAFLSMAAALGGAWVMWAQAPHADAAAAASPAQANTPPSPTAPSHSVAAGPGAAVRKHKHAKAQPR